MTHNDDQTKKLILNLKTWCWRWWHFLLKGIHESFSTAWELNIFAISFIFWYFLRWWWWARPWWKRSVQAHRSCPGTPLPSNWARNHKFLPTSWNARLQDYLRKVRTSTCIEKHFHILGMRQNNVSEYWSLVNCYF